MPGQQPNTPERMRHKLSFRPIGEGDLEVLYRIYAGTRAEELSVMDWNDAQKEEFLRMQFAAQHRFYMKQFSSASFDLILLDRQTIGRLYLDRRVEELRVIDIALLPEYRGQGMGSQLMQDILSEARITGLPVRIHVEKNNPALRLYHRLGFQETEDKGVYYLMQWTPQELSLSGLSGKSTTDQVSG